MINDVRFDPTSGARVSEPWDVIPDVPIAWPRFGGFVIAGPLNVGDRVTLQAFDLDPSAWRATGQRSDPPDARRHGGAYWQATPCDITTVSPMVDAAAAAGELVIGLDGKQEQIRISSSAIQLGASGGDFVALASLVNNAIKAWAVWAASGTGSGYVPPTPATQPNGGTLNVGSTIIKAQ